MAKEKPQEVAQDGGAVWVILFVVIVLVALGYSVLTLI
jgi:flagellar basal body-associated protein FliL